MREREKSWAAVIRSQRLWNRGILPVVNFTLEVFVGSVPAASSTSRIFGKRYALLPVLAEPLLPEAFQRAGRVELPAAILPCGMFPPGRYPCSGSTFRLLVLAFGNGASLRVCSQLFDRPFALPAYACRANSSSFKR
jgi:hypothetical protein